MAVYSKKLHIKKNDGKQQDITLYTTTGEVGSPYLGVKDGNTIVYAKIVATNGANPSQLYVKRGNTTYRVATTAVPPATKINSGKAVNIKYYTGYAKNVIDNVYSNVFDVNFECVEKVYLSDSRNDIGRVFVQFFNKAPYANKSFTGTITFDWGRGSYDNFNAQCSFTNQIMNGSVSMSVASISNEYPFLNGKRDMGSFVLKHISINGSYK